MIIKMSHLRKNYTIKDMSYLDSEEASILYKTQADIIKKHNLKNIVDVGCRTGEVNEYLKDYDYFYYGFDTSKEPIEYARIKYTDQLFEVNDWDNLKNPFKDFGVDAVIFGSILPYVSDAISFFERVCEFYNPKRAIIHEVNTKNKEELNYTNLKYFDKYDNDRYEFELNIPVGCRTIIDVQYR